VPIISIKKRTICILPGKTSSNGACLRSLIQAAIIIKQVTNEATDRAARKLKKQVNQPSPNRQSISFPQHSKNNNRGIIESSGKLPAKTNAHEHGQGKVY
jgi:hypothetical protein